MIVVPRGKNADKISDGSGGSQTLPGFTTPVRPQSVSQEAEAETPGPSPMSAL